MPSPPEVGWTGLGREMTLKYRYTNWDWASGQNETILWGVLGAALAFIGLCFAFSVWLLLT